MVGGSEEVIVDMVFSGLCSVSLSYWMEGLMTRACTFSNQLRRSKIYPSSISSSLYVFFVLLSLSLLSLVMRKSGTYSASLDSLKSSRCIKEF